MSLHDKKPIELEQGWKFMQASGRREGRDRALQGCREAGAALGRPRPI